MSGVCDFSRRCKKAGIEGIKYYGSREYKNYVCWDEGYFDVNIKWK